MAEDFSLPTQRCFLIAPLAAPFTLPFLCLRRGVSGEVTVPPPPVPFSLPTQRCFWKRDNSDWITVLFSAYAEVFPLKIINYDQTVSFLCLRRGVSVAKIVLDSLNDFSLPTQRCFSFLHALKAILPLFSAYAEVFLGVRRRRSGGEPFLCLRRGVSFLSSISHPRDCFSLPTQRCFWRQGVIYGQWRLFSAYAEVFPHSPFGFLPSSSFLCLRRGVSRWKCLSWVVGCFSLPTQRCFRLRRRLLKAIWLFSAYAEVFLPNSRS